MLILFPPFTVLPALSPSPLAGLIIVMTLRARLEGGESLDSRVVSLKGYRCWGGGVFWDISRCLCVQVGR